MEYITTVNIEINSTKIDNPVLSLIIRESMEDHHSFEVHIGLKDNETDVLQMLEKNISQNIKITIELDKKTHLFKGIITRSMVVKSSSSYGELVLEGFSPTVLIDDLKNCAYYNNVSIGDIAKKITEEVPLGIKTNINPAYQVKQKYYMQFRETGYEFLRRIAKLYGEWLFYDGTELTFGSFSPQKAIELEVGSDIYDINLMAEVFPLKFKDKYYNYVPAAEYMVQSATDPGLDSFGKKIKDKSDSVFSHQSVSLNKNIINDQGDLKTMADAKYAGIAGNMVVLTATSRGSALQVGSKINVKGYGSFIITTIVHNCKSMGGYTNNFKAIPASLIRPPHMDSSLTDYPALEIQNAKVTANDDPDGLGRVRVRFYWMESSEQTWWMRVMSASSGKDKGHYFIPEVGDDVLVAFEDNNPNKPYVTGSVYHGNTKPSLWKNPKNYLKGIKTVSGNEILINDEGGKETIKIQQKGGENEIVISLDGTGKITLTTKGDMIFKANKSISFEAGEEIKMKSTKGTSIDAMEFKVNAKTNINLSSSGGDVKLSAINVDAEGQVGAKLKGNATAEISASGQTTVKGAIVMIN